jgi:hypothetical protein
LTRPAEGPESSTFFHWLGLASWVLGAAFVYATIRRDLLDPAFTTTGSNAQPELSEEDFA